MPYVFKQKLRISDLADIKRQPKKILIAEPEEYRLLLYAKHLDRDGYEVARCADSKALLDSLLCGQPHLLVLSVEFYVYLNQTLALLGRIRASFPELAIVTVGYNLDAQQLKRFMGAGVSGHVDRRFSRPQDLAHIVKAILNI